LRADREWPLFAPIADILAISAKTRAVRATALRKGVILVWRYRVRIAWSILPQPISRLKRLSKGIA
jgi:hypothetical protein